MGRHQLFVVGLVVILPHSHCAASQRKDPVEYRFGLNLKRRVVHSQGLRLKNYYFGDRFGTPVPAFKQIGSFARLGAGG